MAVQTYKVDDLDGTKGAETHKLVLDGVAVTVDLGEGNYGKLSAFLEPFFKAGTVKANGTNGESETAKVRAWCAENGVEVNPKGRIPEAIMEQYRAAMA